MRHLNVAYSLYSCYCLWTIGITSFIGNAMAECTVQNTVLWPVSDNYSQHTNWRLEEVYTSGYSIVLSNNHTTGPCATKDSLEIVLSNDVLGCDSGDCTLQRCHLACKKNKFWCTGFEIAGDGLTCTLRDVLVLEVESQAEIDTASSLCFRMDEVHGDEVHGNTTIPNEGDSPFSWCETITRGEDQCGEVFIAAPGPKCMCIVSQHKDIPEVILNSTLNEPQFNSIVRAAWAKVLDIAEHQLNILPRELFHSIDIGVRVNDVGMGGCEGSVGTDAPVTAGPVEMGSSPPGFAQTPGGITTIVLALAASGALLYYKAVLPRNHRAASNRVGESVSRSKVSQNFSKGIKKINELRTLGRADRPAFGAVGVSSSSVTERLPPDWTTVYNPEKPGQPFYKNRATGEITVVQPDLLSLRQYMLHPHSLPPPKPQGMDDSTHYQEGHLGHTGPSFISDSGNLQVLELESVNSVASSDDSDKELALLVGRSFFNL